MLRWIATVQPAWSSFWKKFSRETILTLLFFLPPDRKHNLQRWIRGREQLHTLRKADCVVVSFGKSGRTWLRVMLSRVYQVKHGLPQHYLLSFSNLHLANRAVPKIFFTHDNYLKDYSNHGDSKIDYHDKKVVLLVRHPADIAVSEYHQWRYRMRSHKKALNEYPDHGEEVDIFDFTVHRKAGLKRILDFMDGWARAIPGMPSLLMVRYEDLRANPEETLGRILDFLGTPGSAAEVREAVSFASFENMKKLESEQAFRFRGGRYGARDPNNPQSAKVRRGKVGGYHDYFSTDQVAEIDAIIKAHLSPLFGYNATTTEEKTETA
jgi:hypothetical protein